MPLIYQHRIYRKDLQANPNVLYLFGDNLVRKGLGGQAGEMRGEPNAVGIATKYYPDMSSTSFFDDTDIDSYKSMWELEFTRPTTQLLRGGIVVMPLDGLGTGLSELPTRAPLSFEYLVNKIKQLECIRINSYADDFHRSQGPLFSGENLLSREALVERQGVDLESRREGLGYAGPL